MDTGFDPAWIEHIEPAEVYKHDARSRVWRIEPTDGRAYVVKRFEFNPLRQALGVAAGLHPGQRERRWSAKLAAAGLPVASIVASGTQGRGLGLRLWLVTPYVGVSLFNLFHHGQLADQARRVAILDAVGRLTGNLAHQGYFNRDHKASNIVIDAGDRPVLIDYGAVRRSRGDWDTQRMLSNLCANLVEAGAGEDDLQRVKRACSAITSKA